MKKSIFIIFFLCCLVWDLFSQLPSNHRTKFINPVLEEIKIDSLSIIPGSLFVFDHENGIIPDSLYVVNYGKSTIFFIEEIVSLYEEVTIKYRVFSFSFAKDYYLRDTSEIFLRGIKKSPPSSGFLKDPFLSQGESKIFSNGSISRGLMIGNQQDVIFNSQLNLQLTGKLTEKLNIEAAISDNNIPLQPEGYSQKIQEFDKVYISVYNENLRLTTGDFEITDSRDYFFKMNRKAQGVLFSGNFYDSSDSLRFIETTVSASVAKGRFTRNTIRAVEGSQGPYRLTGENNELYIVILAGTERVFLDGKLLSRGLENDYVIDYNLAEIVFTANQPINRNKRIVVEFEYSDRNYPRFMAYTNNRVTFKNSSFHLGFYTEQDAKNQPLQQQLNQEQKSLLASIGDSIHRAFVPKIDSIEFSNNYVLYKRVDSLVNSVEYKNVYSYSVNPLEAHFRLNFTYLGENKGNYIPDTGSANGRVYKWVAPVADVPQGTHEPVIFLVTPKKQQVLSLGAETKMGKNSSAQVEMAMSNADINTFSSLDNNDNTGFAIRLSTNQNIFTADSNRFQMRTRFGYELTGKNFATAERYRPVEFERDWNVRLSELKGNEHLVFGEAQIKTGNFGLTAYNINYFKSEEFEGVKNFLQSTNNFIGFKTNLRASYLTTTNQMVSNTVFFRHNFDISRPLGQIVLGFVSEGENNSWEATDSDSLLNKSFKNRDLAFYLQNSDISENKWRLEARHRNDYLPSGVSFKPFTTSRELSGTINLLKNPKHIFKARLNLRSVDYQELNDSVSNENSFSGRMEYNGRFLKGALVTSTYIETIAGREQKKEFFYLEVPAGQGVFKWIDYNGNGIKELDEFEIAGFPDEANHIRVLLPTNLWVKTHINQLGQTINIQPALVWRNKNGLRKFISRFSNQASFRTIQKIQEGELMDFLRVLDFSMNDSLLVNLNANLRNTLSFNCSSPHYGADYILQKNWSKILLVNGADQRQLTQHIFRLRWSPVNSIIFFPEVERGLKSNSSEFFPSRNYQIDLTSFGSLVQYQVDLKLQMKLSYRYSLKENRLSFEENKSHEIKLEGLYSVPANFQINTQFRYLFAGYNASGNTAIAYEMLEGLIPGTNLNWNLFIQKSLPNNLEITVNYNGRVSKGRDVIHTGGIQARAYF